MIASPDCPDPEMLAAFVSGALSGSELQRVGGHMRGCVDCREVARSAAEIDREAVTILGTVQRRRPEWLTLAAAALAGIFRWVFRR